MSRRVQKIAVATLLIIISAVALIVFVKVEFAGQPAVPVSQGYLRYKGEESKIYLVTATSSYDTANESYTTLDGQFVQAGTPLFIVTVTLRNDYSFDDAPPAPNGLPVSPADGTAYVYFTARLYDGNGAINATNVTVPDFWLPSTPGTALVLGSGETASANIYMATDSTSVTQFEVELIFLGDSIPT